MASENLRLVYEHLLRERDVSPSDRIVDIGSKDGIILDELVDAFDAGGVAADVAFQLESGRQYDIDFVAADGRRLPFADASVDAVICHMVFEHVPFEEAARILSADGTFICIFPNRVWPIDSHGFPVGTPWLPKGFGERVLGPFLNESKQRYYRNHLFPVSSPGVRRHLRKHFRSVQYDSRALLEVDLHLNTWRARLVEAMAGGLLKGFRLPFSRTFLEVTFPVGIYTAT